MTTCLVFVAAVSWTALILGGLWGYLTVDLCWAAVWAGMAASLASLRSSVSPANLKRPSLADILIFFFFLSVCLRVLLWIYFDKGGSWAAPELVYPRLLAFIAKIRNFSEGQVFWPQNPVHASEHYLDFGFPLFFAVFQKLAVPFASFLTLIAVSAAVILMGALWLWAGGLGVAAFLALGGTYGLYLLGVDFWEGVRGFGTAETVFYSSLPVMVFLSHPEFLFVFPAGILLAVSLRRRLDFSESFLPAWVEVLLWATLALYHLQSFILLSVFFLIGCLGRRREFSSPVFWTFLKVCIFLFPFSFFLTGAGKVPDVLGAFHLKNAFREGSGTAYVLRNAAWFIPWLLACLITPFRDRDKRNALCMTLPAACGFVFFLCFDTNARVGSSLPLMAWCYVFLLPVLFEKVIRPRRPFFRILLSLLLLVPGLMIYKPAFRNFFSNQVTLGSRENLHEICEAVHSLPRGERFAASLQIDHPLAACGVPVVSVYNDVAFYDGAGERAVCLNLRRLLSGDKDWRQLAESLGVRYLFWGPLEERDFGSHSKRPWENVAPKVISESWGTVYDLGKPGPLFAKPSGGQGLEARFYGNKTFQGEPVMIRMAGTIDFHWDDTSREILRTPLGIVFEGEVWIPESEEITYYLVSDDGSRLFLDDESVIDNGGNHPLMIKSAKKTLPEGWHRIRVEYDNEWGVGTLRLWWKLRSGEEVIPQKFLRPFPAEAENQGTR